MRPLEPKYNTESNCKRLNSQRCYLAKGQRFNAVSHAARTTCRSFNTVSHASRSTYSCLLYTSDAADDLLCVDLGGRRIIKKKKI